VVSPPGDRRFARDESDDPTEGGRWTKVTEQMTEERHEEQARAATGPEAKPSDGGHVAGVSAVEAVQREGAKGKRTEAVFELKDVAVDYDGNPAVREITLDIYRNQITALIGPSGCGKSTLIRCLNRMNDLIPAARVHGEVLYHGENLYDDEVDPVQVRKRIGMVFQKPNPFPKSIYDNIAFGPRVLGMKGDLDALVERAIRRAALWDEVKDRLKENAFGLSGGQQQRLCIARCLAIEPDAILMDEPCSALDPISTGRIEDLMHELRENYSIVIVTHNMQQAARVSQMTAFLTVDLDADERSRWGRLVEYDDTEKVFTNPSDQRTEAYVTGKVG
jgi:phosphate transport system ATP-binding protein